MSGKVEQSNAIRKVCEFALSLRERMPNITCTEETSRYVDDFFDGMQLKDRVTTRVSYEDGHESYQDIAINGQPVHSSAPDLQAAWTTGEFANSLQAIFLPQSHAEIAFRKREVHDSIAMLVFDFHIRREQNRSFSIRIAQLTDFPGYSGEILVSESDGRLARLAKRHVEVDPNFPIREYSATIDYAEVQLGDGTSFDLPVKSEIRGCRTAAQKPCWINRVEFRNWRKFAGKARLVTESGSQPDALAAPGSSHSATAVWEQLRSAQLAFPGKARPTLVARQPEVEMAAASELPASAALQASNSPSTVNPDASEPMKIKVNVNLVPVRVVVRDSQGRTVGGLSKENFHIFDKGKPQVISQFSADQSSPAAPAAAGGRSIAYLFDDVHLAFGLVARARDAFERHLSLLRPGDRAALLTTSGRTVLTFTDDREKLRAAATQLQANPLYLGQSGCLEMSYYMADLIEGKNDPAAMQSQIPAAARCGVAKKMAVSYVRGIAQQQLLYGDQESHLSLENLKIAVQAMAALKDQKSIVFISPGFLVRDPGYAYSEILDRALRAEVVIDTLDARGVYVPADGPTNQFSSQELSADSDILSLLADGTGGTFFHSNNDLEGGLAQLIAPPEFSYLLGFSPQGLKANGSFHSLKVTVEATQKVSVQSRPGYYAPKKPDQAGSHEN